MKKFITVLLIFILCIAPVSAFAENVIPEETNIMMGDVNLDGRVTAMDARTALRYAARMEPSDGVKILSIDADGDGRITASDARAILRVSAKISKFVTGFDGKGTPNVINTLRSNVYYIDVLFTESADSQHEFILAKNNEDSFIETDDKSIISNMQMGNLKFTKCGIMTSGEDLYILFSTEDTDIAMFCSKDTMEKADINPEEFNEMIAMIDKFVPDELGIPMKVEINGEEMFCYTYMDGNQQCQMYIGTNGVLSHIDGVLANGDVQTLLTFNKISGDKTDKYFSTDNFDEIW